MDKRRLVRRLLRLQNRLINPPMCWAIDHGLMPPTYSLPDDDAYERQRHLAHGRPGYQLDGILLRALATDMLTIRVDLDPPTMSQGGRPRA